MGKRKIGKRRSRHSKIDDARVKPLSSTGEKDGGSYLMICTETWSANEITLEKVRERWFSLYHPAGYDTIVIGKVENGILTTEMTRAKSCD